LVPWRTTTAGTAMDQKELLKKIEQIEEQARDGEAEFPALAKERLRMILGFARYIRTELTHTGGPSMNDGDGGASNDDGIRHSA
jgi:hypothetical protein